MPTVRTDDGTAISYSIHGGGIQNVLFMHGWAGSAAGPGGQEQDCRSTVARRIVPC